MEFNADRKRASEVYLLSQYSQHTGPPAQRRSTIFHEFVRLGMQTRWEWHRKAETYTFSEEEKSILEACRTWEARSIAFWISESDGRDIVLMTSNKSTLEVNAEDPDYQTAGEPSWLYCEFEENDGPFGVLPEIAYSLSMFDDPADVAEAKEESILQAREKGSPAEPEQSLWVSGVFFWRERGLIVWVDEFGETVREMTVDTGTLKEDAKMFERYKPFETSWWRDARRVGKYAEEEWWL